MGDTSHRVTRHPGQHAGERNDDRVDRGLVGRVAARYMPHTECEAYVAGPPEMVRETIRVLARAGLEPERIHFDDALLAGKPRTGTGT